MTRFYRAGKTGGTERGRRPGRGSRGPTHPPTEGHPDSEVNEPFDIDEAFRRLRLAVANLPKAAMFDLRDRGYSSPFEQLVGALISARTRDETTVKVCLRLFEVARTPQEMLALDEGELTRLLAGASFAEVKARDIRAIARRIVEEWGGQVPDSLEALTSLRGVGPKIAALDAGRRLRPPGDRRRYPRPPDCQPMGLSGGLDAREEHARPGHGASRALLD